MGASNDTFIKYPRTPHLFGSRGTDDDQHLGRVESADFIADPSLIVEEKLDGTNVGIHFTTAGRMVLQCRGHEISEGMHAQYDLFKQWTMGKRPVLEAMLEDRFILFGEWLYAGIRCITAACRTISSSSTSTTSRTGEFLDLATTAGACSKGPASSRCPVVHRGELDEDSFAHSSDHPSSTACSRTRSRVETDRPDGGSLSAYRGRRAASRDGRSSCVPNLSRR